MIGTTLLFAIQLAQADLDTVRALTEAATAFRPQREAFRDMCLRHGDLPLREAAPAAGFQPVPPIREQGETAAWQKDGIRLFTLAPSRGWSGGCGTRASLGAATELRWLPETVSAMPEVVNFNGRRLGWTLVLNGRDSVTMRGDGPFHMTMDWTRPTDVQVTLAVDRAR